MEQSWKTLFLLTFFCTFGLMTSAKAQITPDNSLGAETSTVGQPNQAINGIPINQIDQINGGARRQGNLFHSFGEFNVNAGRAAYFSNPDGVGNILTRVTGVNRSNILGTLGVLGNANLFLINPNGIFFGPNSSLDVRGSFLGSTANSLIFDNGFEFSATNLIAPPLLTVNIPVGLRFRDNPGEIRVQGLGQTAGLNGASSGFSNPTLEVPPGQNLTLVGGNVNLDGGVLQATGGRVQLGGLTTAGTVGINPNQTLSFPNGVQRGDVSLINQAGINVIANQLGGNAGGIDINTGTLSLLDGAIINASTFATGDAGRIKIQASDISLNGVGSNGRVSGIFSTVEDNAVGNADGIDITTGTLSLLNGAQIVASTFNQGNAGSVKIQASDISLNGVGSNGRPSAIFSTVQGNAVGNGGGIDITTGKLSLFNGARIVAGTFGRGDAGIVKIQASDISLNGVGSTGFSSGIFSTVQDNATGNAGGIDISTKTLSLFNGAVINASTFATGDAGSVKIQASDTIEASGVGSFDIVSGILSNVEQDATGNAGGIDISTKTLSFFNGAVLSASTFGNGNAGNVRINASDRITISGSNPNNQGAASGIFANTASGSTGNGGNITIQPLQNSLSRIAIADGGQVRVDSQGQGVGGEIFITGNSLTLDRGTINASTASANGGNITLTLRNFLRLQNESLIEANARGLQAGNAGNITIDAPLIVAFPQNNDITANAVSGSGGQVTTNAILFGIISRTRADLERLGVPGLNPRNLSTSDITAFSENPNIPDNVVAQNNVGFNLLLELQEITVSDRTQQIAQNPCQQGIGNEFVVTGRGGLPTTPNQTLSSDNVRVDLLQPVASSGNSRSATITKPATNPTATRVPAQGWIFNDKGQVVLTAYDPTNTGSQRSFSTAAACPAR